MPDEVLFKFNLVGGTALSLNLGHRKSLDIDLFTDTDFDASYLANHLTKTYNATITRVLTNGIFAFINDVKVDLLAHQYPIINPIEIKEGIRMLSLEDIGAMKLNAILYNGTRLKNFVDIYALVEYIPLNKITRSFVQKYPGVTSQMAYNALLYHNDIDMTMKIDYINREIPWKEITGRLNDAVTNDQKIFS
ncbi:MAG: nucleotidyl transferase AbiEii/AbiGii toxin family protein [Chitinophagaceae bacterium]|nr:nucleotidyl transferase AbiEii/AbiGii toxin family protein [Chitinophagaceae bacterium]